MAQRIEAVWNERTMVPEVASVLLTVPAHKDYITAVRSSVAQLGGCFGFTIGEIEDLRLAVDEACNLLVAGAAAAPDTHLDDAAGPNAGPGAGAGGHTLQCRAAVHGDLLHVTVAAPAAAGVEPPDTEGFGWIILTALVDALTWDQDDDTVRVELEKRRGIRDG